MSLIPKDSSEGWTPYAWLVYLAILVVGPVLSRASALEWALTALGISSFLVLYFLGYHVRGRRLLAVIAAITLLGVVFSPFNWGGSVFFIYAAAFLGRLGPPRVGVRYLAAIVAIVALEAWLVPLPPQAWLPGIVFSLLIGGVNLHFGEVARAGARLRLAQEEVERLARMAERERIGRDLHDLLGHTLSLVTLKAELAAKLAQRDPVRAEIEMREVERISRQALAEVRRAVRGYRHLSLEAELSRARLTLGSAGLELELEAAPVRLAAEAESALALALREAVTNVVRHARAGRCRIEVGPAGEEARLVVTDDGRGGEAPEGAGLAGMRERVEALGGRVERAGATSGRGTRLTVVLPAADEAAAPRWPQAAAG